jgi:hypothetical protein
MEVDDMPPCRQKITEARMPPMWLSSTEDCPREEEIEAMRSSDPSPPWPAGGSNPSPEIHPTRLSGTAALLKELVVLLVFFGSGHRNWRRRERSPTWR